MALSNLAENCRFLKKHTSLIASWRGVAFLRTLHHVNPPRPTAAAKVQGPKVWQVDEDGAWKDVPAEVAARRPRRRRRKGRGAAGGDVDDVMVVFLVCISRARFVQVRRQNPFLPGL